MNRFEYLININIQENLQCYCLITKKGVHLNQLFSSHFFSFALVILKPGLEAFLMIMETVGREILSRDT